jgi:hypothetical protein
MMHLCVPKEEEEDDDNKVYKAGKTKRDEQGNRPNPTPQAVPKRTTQPHQLKRNFVTPIAKSVT